MDPLKHDDDYEQREEERLLGILETRDSHLQLTAFKRLVKIYKTKPESELIYNFLENHNFNNHETVNFLLECFFEFLDHREHSGRTRGTCSNNQRIEKIYQNEKIMQSLMSLIKCAHAQTNLLIILIQVLQVKPCREQWIDDIVEVFYSTRRESIEDLAGKVLIILMKSNHRFSYSSANLIQRKLSRYDLGKDAIPASGSDKSILREVKRVWEERKGFGVEQYIDLLASNDQYLLARFANQVFIKEHAAEIDERIDDISELYLNAVQAAGDSKIATLEHMSHLLDYSELFAKKLAKGKFLDALYDLADGEDKDLAYYSAKIISRVLSSQAP